MIGGVPIIMLVTAVAVALALRPKPALMIAAVLISTPVVGTILYRPARLLFIFIVMLPLHQLMMMTLLHLSGSWTLTRLMQPWKDLLALGALVAVIGIWVSAGRRTRWRLLDRLIIGYFILNILYLIGPWDTSIEVRLFGLRSNTFLVTFYALGRMIPLSRRRQHQVLSVLLMLGAAAGVFALVDRFLLPIDWPARIGFTEYVSQGTGVIGGRMGLSWTFWTSTGLRRASSFFANPLDFAASAHLTGVTALVVALSYPKRNKRRAFALAVFWLIVIGLLLSISRTSTVVFLLECILVLILMGRSVLIPPLLALIAVGGAIILALNPKATELIYQTITFENPSSLGHLSRWQEGIAVLLESPLGLGPGTSGRVGARFGSQVGGESQYIVLGVELGIVGIVLYLILQWTALVYALNLFRYSHGSTRMLALIACVSRFGISLAGITAPIESYLFVSFINWWLIGFVILQSASGRTAFRRRSASKHSVATPVQA